MAGPSGTPATKTRTARTFRAPRARSARRRNLPALAPSLPGICGEAGFRSHLAEHHVGTPLVAARDTDRVFQALEAAYPWPLHRGLDEVTREDSGGGGRAVHVEPTALQRRLDRFVLTLE